ncbi:Na(+)/H(+) antiporter subunit C [Kytococcus sp. Marseille-QA3725]
MTDPMTPSLALLAAGAVLVGCGVYLLLARSIVRMLIGFVLVGNGVNLLFLSASAPPGEPPLIGQVPAEDMADPLPQAMMLTAIVISLGLVSFLLALAHRSWQLSGTDRVTHDPEDLRIVLRADRNDMSGSQFQGDDDLTPDDVDDADIDEEGDHYMEAAVRRFKERRREIRRHRARAFQPLDDEQPPVDSRGGDR